MARSMFAALPLYKHPSIHMALKMTQNCWPGITGAKRNSSLEIKGNWPRSRGLEMRTLWARHERSFPRNPGGCWLMGETLELADGSNWLMGSAEGDGGNLVVCQ